MTNLTPKPIPTPALIVYGTPTSSELTQASWFRAEDKQAAAAAAVGLNFAVIEIRSEVEMALTAGVHEGVLKGSGRMIVGSVEHAVYQKIEAYARKLASGDLVPKGENSTKAGSEAITEQNMNIVSTPGASGGAQKDAPLPTTANPWDTLKVGARVLAAYWNTDREFEGFWIANVKRIEGAEITLEWFDQPEYPAFKTAAKNVAPLHPHFRVTGP